MAGQDRHHESPVFIQHQHRCTRHHPRNAGRQGLMWIDCAEQDQPMTGQEALADSILEGLRSVEMVGGGQQGQQPFGQGPTGLGQADEGDGMG
ncbi:MAG: hypothetical protein U5O69_02280 [Candidatus Competibacteraceae bacterium]|nr:hypothetical protein [Candidatus Competibacteraceae bacterium]